MATQAAYTAFRRVYATAESGTASEQEQIRAARYAHMWALYENSIYDDAAAWGYYKGYYGLYRYIRSIYNPVRRLVDFYAGIVYPGVLVIDPEMIPDGTLSAIPFAEDTDPELLAAIAQLWQWSNWQIGSSIMVTYGASMGDVAVEVKDDPRRGIVYTDVLWPWLIDDLELDPTGNVKSYAVQYDYHDEDAGKRSTYRKEVDGERIATFRNGDLYSYADDLPAEYANPYGFAPMVWAKHKDVGGTFGKPAVRNLAIIDDLNSVASHMVDHAQKIMGMPVLFSGGDLDWSQSDEGVATAKQSNPMRGKQKIKIVKAAPGATVSAVTLPDGDALAQIQWLADEVERTHPELTLYQRLREQSQVTGPGAEAMSGDVKQYVLNARASYDTQSVKLFQMSVAIGGYRANSGAWGRELTGQQTKFLPFNLDSYRAGALDLQILPRPIIPMSPVDAVNYELSKLHLEQERAAAAQPMPALAEVEARIEAARAAKAAEAEAQATDEAGATA